MIFSLRSRLSFVWISLVIVLAGCASARVADYQIDDDFRSHQWEQAISKLKAGLAKEGSSGRDRLLYLFDLGITYFSAGRYAEAIKVFFEADRYSDISDYTSLSTEAATLLVSDNSKPYKGEDFEKVMINTYLAMCFALQGNWEDGLVEARIVHRKLYRMIYEGERKYKQNAFARYLSALLYEAEGNWNDAYVDYKLVHDLEPQTKDLGIDLWRLAFLTENEEDMDRWQKEYALTKVDKDRARERYPRSGLGEIILLFENGQSPVKKPNPSWNSLPHFYSRYNPVSSASIEIPALLDPGCQCTKKAESFKLHDIEATAIQNMEDNYAGAVAKKMAGAVAKVVVGKQVENITGSRLAGFLTQLALFGGDSADLRSWRLLPKDLEIARLSAPPGKHMVKIQLAGVPAEIPLREVEVKPGQKTFINFRYTPPY